jgi:uncharacterized repeat protein (TIGR04138 family)
MNETMRKSLEQVVAECGKYPVEAFEFVRQGLNWTVDRIHGAQKDADDTQRHISGRQLCEGLRDFAVRKYGIMAKAVLTHWRITRTADFGRIVFVMVESRLMQKTDDDDIRDFEDVFDFATAFEPAARPQLSRSPVFHL